MHVGLLTAETPLPGIKRARSPLDLRLPRLRPGSSWPHPRPRAGATSGVRAGSPGPNPKPESWSRRKLSPEPIGGLLVDLLQRLYSFRENPQARRQLNRRDSRGVPPDTSAWFSTASEERTLARDLPGIAAINRWKRSRLDDSTLLATRSPTSVNERRRARPSSAERPWTTWLAFSIRRDRRATLLLSIPSARPSSRWVTCWSCRVASRRTTSAWA